jgi:hypothetical protein
MEAATLAAIADFRNASSEKLRCSLLRHEESNRAPRVFLFPAKELFPEVLRDNGTKGKHGIHGTALW